MSVLPSATFAGPGPAEALWAVAGSAGPGGGVTQLVAGTNITLDPPTGEGVVTINAAGGGGGGVTSVTASGAGITATPTTGAVVVANTGVTSIVAGTGVTVSGPTGAVTINAPGGSGLRGWALYPYVAGSTTTITPSGTCGRILLGTPSNSSSDLFGNDTGGTGWQLKGQLIIGGPNVTARTRCFLSNFRVNNISSTSSGSLVFNFLNVTLSTFDYTTVQIQSSGPLPSSTVPTQYSVDFFLFDVAD